MSTINLKHIDIILISNYQNMLALPYITERSDFEGVVYATEPTLEIARKYMEEMLEYIERCPKIKQASIWKRANYYKNIPFPFGPDIYHNCKPYSWQQIFTAKEMQNSLSKVKTVGFSQRIVIYYFIAF